MGSRLVAVWVGTLGLGAFILGFYVMSNGGGIMGLVLCTALWLFAAKSYTAALGWWNTAESSRLAGHLRKKQGKADRG